MEPLVSVIVTTYNAEKFIERALDSVLRQTYPNIEILAVDDGSTDSTAAILARYQPRVRTLYQPNSGVCVARNRGAAETRGSLLAFLDADDVWLPEKIATQVAAFGKHPHVGAVAVNFDEIDADDRPLTRLMKRPTHLYGAPRNIYRELLDHDNFLAISAVMISRAAFEASNGFFAEHRILSADYDLWIRMSEFFEFLILPDLLCHYRVLPVSALHGSLEKEYGAQLNILGRHRARFTESQYRERLAQLYRDWADSALYARDRSAWKAWRDAVRMDPLHFGIWMMGMRAAARRLVG
jgi:glycosyltransferase involved in cell wall biosynthesis